MTPLRQAVQQRNSRCSKALVDRHNGCYSLDSILEALFDTRLKRHGTRWTPHTGPVKPHRYHTIRINIDQFDIASVRLDGRPDEVQHLGDLGSQLMGVHHCRMVRHCGRRGQQGYTAGMRYPLILIAVLMLAACGQTIHDPGSTLQETGRSPRIHVACMELLDEQVGLNDEAYRETLHAILWRPGYTNTARREALDRLWAVDADAAIRTIRQRLPRMGNWTWLSELCQWIGEQQIAELDAALVSSWARPTQRVESEQERPEYLALAAIHGAGGITDLVFASFAESNKVWQQGYRTRCWELLHRLNQRERLLQLVSAVDATSDDALLLDLRDGVRDLGILPRNREEILWMRELRSPERATFWTEAVSALQNMPASRRLHLELRDVPVAVAAHRHAPHLLATSTGDMLSEIDGTLQGRRHYFETEGGGQASTKSEQFRTHRDVMTWGDAAAILLALRAIQTPQVADHLLDYAERDRLDDTTEYGGVIALDEEGRFEVLEFEPIVRHHDRRFNAPQQMLDAAYDSLFHFHNHAQRHRNGDHAGPGMGDKNYADNTRANCLVFSFVNEDTMNVDFYRHGHVVVDLGTMRRGGRSQGSTIEGGGSAQFELVPNDPASSKVAMTIRLPGLTLFPVEDRERWPDVTVDWSASDISNETTVHLTGTAGPLLGYLAQIGRFEFSFTASGHDISISIRPEDSAGTLTVDGRVFASVPIE